MNELLKKSFMEFAASNEVKAKQKKPFLSPYVPPYRRDKEIKVTNELSTSSLSDESSMKNNFDEVTMNKDVVIELPNKIIQRINKLATNNLNLDFKIRLNELYEEEFEEDLPLQIIKSLKFSGCLTNVVSPAHSVPEKMVKNSSKLSNSYVDEIAKVEPLKPSSLDYEHLPKQFWIKVHACNNTGELWGVILDEEHFEQVEMLSDQMTPYYESERPEPLSITKDDFYALYDGSWHRVKCLDITDNQVIVFFIDRGDQDKIEKNKLRRLHPKFCKLPAQAVKFSLAGLEVFSDLEDVKIIIEHILLEKIVLAEINGVSQVQNRCLPVNLYMQDKEKDIKIFEFLLHQIFEKYLESENFMKLNTLMPCQVQHVSNKGHVYIRLITKALKYFFILMKNATDQVSNNNYKKHIVVKFDRASVYFVYNNKDYAWHRAWFMSPISENDILVHLIDVGSFIIVHRQNIISLEKLSKVLTLYPPQAVRVSLDQLPILEEIQIAKLQQMTVKLETLYVKFKSIPNSSHPIVQLLRKTNDDMISLNDSLLLLTSKSNDNQDLRNFQKQTSVPNEWRPTLDKNSSINTSKPVQDNWRPTWNRSVSASEHLSCHSLEGKITQPSDAKKQIDRPASDFKLTAVQENWRQSTSPNSTLNEENESQHSPAKSVTSLNSSKRHSIIMNAPDQTSLRYPITKSKSIIMSEESDNSSPSNQSTPSKHTDKQLPIKDVSNKQDEWQPLTDNVTVNNNLDSYIPFNKKNDAFLPDVKPLSTSKENVVKDKYMEPRAPISVDDGEWGETDKMIVIDEDKKIEQTTSHFSNALSEKKIQNENQSKLLSAFKNNDNDKQLSQQNLAPQTKVVHLKQEINNGTTVNVVTVEHQNKNLWISKVLNAPVVPKDTGFDVHVVLAHDPTHFVVHSLCRRNGEFKEMVTKMAQVCPTYESPKLTYETCVIGQMYTIKGDDDDMQWYRVYLLRKIDKDTVYVYLCDYGNYKPVKINQLKVLHNRFFSVPYQAIWCELNGLAAPGEVWSKENCLRFKNLTLGKNFVCTVVRQKDMRTNQVESGMPTTIEMIHVVELIDTSTSDDIYITNVLVAEGHAKDVRPEDERLA